MHAKSPRGIMAKVPDCSPAVSKFVPQLLYYVHIRINILIK